MFSIAHVFITVALYCNSASTYITLYYPTTFYVLWNARFALLICYQLHTVQYVLHGVRKQINKMSCVKSLQILSRTAETNSCYL